MMRSTTSLNVRHTVCVAPVGLATYNINACDAEHAASIGAPAVSPHKPNSPADREWLRFYHRARTAPSGITSYGYRIAA